MKKIFSETKLGILLKLLKEGYPDVKNEYSDYSIFIENGGLCNRGDYVGFSDEKKEIIEAIENHIRYSDKTIFRIGNEDACTDYEIVSYDKEAKKVVLRYIF